MFYVCVFLFPKALLCMLVALAQVRSLFFFCAKLPLKWLWRLYVQHIYEKDYRPVLSGWLLNEQEIVFVYMYIYIYRRPICLNCYRAFGKKQKFLGLFILHISHYLRLLLPIRHRTGTHVLIPYYLFYMRVNLLLLNLDALMSGTVKRQKIYEI